MLDYGYVSDVVVVVQTDYPYALSGAAHYPQFVYTHTDDDTSAIGDHEVIIVFYRFDGHQHPGFICNLHGFNPFATPVG